MASSLREQLLARVLAILSPGGSIGAQSVSRSRETSITRAISPAVVIMPVNTDIAKIDRNANKHQHEFAVEIFVRDDPWDSLADPIDVAAHAALDADLVSLQAGALGTFVESIDRIGEAFEAQEADRTAGTLTVRYRATFISSRHALDRPWP